MYCDAEARTARDNYVDQQLAAARAVVARLEADVIDARAREARTLRALGRALERLRRIQRYAQRGCVQTRDPVAQLLLGSLAALAAANDAEGGQSMAG